MQVLSAIAVKQAACKSKPYKITDGGGLYILIKAKELLAIQLSICWETENSSIRCLSCG